MSHFDVAMKDFFDAIRSVTGAEPIVYNDQTGSFDFPMAAGQVTPEESFDTPKKVVCEEGKVQLIQNGHTELLGAGSSVQVEANIFHHLRALTPARIAYSFV